MGVFRIVPKNMRAQAAQIPWSDSQSRQQRTPSTGSTIIRNLRERFTYQNVNTLSQLFDGDGRLDQLCKYVQEALKIYA